MSIHNDTLGIVFQNIPLYYRVVRAVCKHWRDVADGLFNNKLSKYLDHGRIECIYDKTSKVIYSVVMGSRLPQIGTIFNLIVRKLYDQEIVHFAVHIDGFAIVLAAYYVYRYDAFMLTSMMTNVNDEYRGILRSYFTIFERDRQYPNTIGTSIEMPLFNRDHYVAFLAVICQKSDYNIIRRYDLNIKYLLYGGLDWPEITFADMIQISKYSIRDCIRFGLINCIEYFLKHDYVPPSLIIEESYHIYIDMDVCIWTYSKMVRQIAYNYKTDPDKQYKYNNDHKIDIVTQNGYLCEEFVKLNVTSGLLAQLLYALNFYPLTHSSRRFIIDKSATYFANEIRQEYPMALNL